ncbi:MAG: enoyl-CoA hydratase/isomerase family protein [Gemmatimonadetes bacterium]|nr:enoyl-CoA hydratase/isomerase family protein [Gemmatimonadota bacterium]
MTTPATAPDPGTVTATIADGIATVSFFHPKGNSLPSALLRRLAETITEVGHSRDARVILLQSEGGGSFCAGASFDELVSINDEATGRDFFMGFARVILAMRAVPQFIVTRVHGKVAGGGIGIVAASEYAIARSDAAIKLSELAIGIGPFVVGPAVERKMGVGAFQALTVDADFFPAAWAAQHGLYAKVADTQAEFDAVLAGTLKKLSHANPEAMAQLKRIFWAGTEHWPTLLPERAAMSGTLVLSEFTRNAIARFKGK